MERGGLELIWLNIILLKRFFDDRISTLGTLIFALIPFFVSRSVDVVRGPVYWFFLVLGLYFLVVHIDKGKNDQVLFVVSHYDLGLLGIKVKTDENITGIAENYTLKLKPTAKVKIYKPDEDLREIYLIRALIEITGKDECEIIYSLPGFFKQLGV